MFWHLILRFEIHFIIIIIQSTLVQSLLFLWSKHLLSLLHSILIFSPRAFPNITLHIGGNNAFQLLQKHAKKNWFCFKSRVGRGGNKCTYNWINAHMELWNVKQDSLTKACRWLSISFAVRPISQMGCKGGREVGLLQQECEFWRGRVGEHLAHKLREGGTDTAFSVSNQDSLCRGLTWSP